MTTRTIDQRLVEAFKATRSPIIVAGAGVSKASSRHAATWTELLEKAIRYAEARGIDCSDLTLSAERTPLELATRIQARLANRFSAWLFDCFRPWQLDSPAAIDALAKLKVPLTTTNYDKLLSSCLRLEPVPASNSDFAQRVLGGDAGILHFHGVYSDASSVVFGDDDYRRIRDDERRQFNQQVAAAAHTMVFVGCGGTIDDPNFGELLRWVENWPGGSHEHFRLNCASEIERRRERTADDSSAHKGDGEPHRSSVLTITYGDDYGDLADYLARLAREVSKPSVTNPPPRSGAPPLDAEALRVGVSPGHSSQVTQVAVDSARGVLAAVCSERATLWAYPTSDDGAWSELWGKPNDAGPLSIAFLADGRLAVGTAKGLRLHAAKDGRVKRLGSEELITSVALDRAGSLLAARYVSTAEWSGTRLKTSGVLMIDHWGNVESTTPVVSLAAGDVMATDMATGPDTRWLATINRLKRRSIWARVADVWKEVWPGKRALSIDEHRVAWSRCGSRLAVLSHARVTVYDTSRLSELHDEDIETLISTEKKWTPEQWCEVELPRAASALALSSEGNFLAVGTDRGDLLLSQISNRERPQAVHVEGSPQHPVTELSFDESGSLLAVAAANYVHLYRLQ